MKYIITLVLLTMFFHGQILPQEKNKNIPSPYKALIEKLNVLHNAHVDDQNNFIENETFTSELKNNKLLQILKNLDDKFNNAFKSNDKNTRAISSETMLADGFLMVENIIQSWDGAAWVNSLRGTNLYDPKNNRIQSTYQNWNTTTLLWENSYRYSYIYDSNDNRTEYTYLTWDGTSWVNNSRYLFTFDLYNNQIEQISQSWSGGIWTNSYRYVNTYNVNNKLTISLYQTWNGIAWADVDKYTYTYDSINNRIGGIYQTWNGMVWVDVYRFTSTFDVNNNLIQQINENWDGTSWVNSDKYNITYDTSENPTEYLFQVWDVSVWKNDFKYSYIYDTNNNLIEGLYQSWDISLWKNEQKFTATYNANNDPTEYLYQTWDVTVWKNDSKYKYIYDSNNNNTEYTYQFWAGTSWVNQSKYLYTWAVETSIVLTSPNGGENWAVGTSKNITWTSSNIANVKLQYSTNNGTNWINITNVSASAGTFAWTVPNAISANCKVLISDVSNALLFDESDSVFSIGPTPSLTVNSPNGGESWDVGSSHSITWTSVSIDNVKIDYSTNNGTSWTNVIASTAASAGSYNWTVPNTASTNCKVLISDVSNALVNDQSNAVFTIYAYPATMNVSTSYSFGDATKTSSYQIIGLPGANNLLLASIITGSPGATGDWRAFWDPGAGALTEYTSSGSTFNFTPGKAFWVISKNQIAVNIPNVNTVTLASDNYYSIPVHSEWNLISNPFDKVITWSNVQAANSGITQPIHFYQAGSYTNPANFDPYKGYYFFNSGSLTNLKIPYSTTNALPKQNSVNGTEMEISLKTEGVLKGLISIGVSEDAKQGVDLLDIFSPPSQFCEVNMSLYNNELETNYKFLQKDYRPEIGEGQEFNFNVKNISDQTLNMIVSGLDNFKDYEIFLLDKNLSKLYDLKKINSFEVKINNADKEYSLLIGTDEFIMQKKLDILPTEFSLFQNYPNPFNPTTRIMFSLPQQSHVSLKIYNVLGELAADLINNQVFEAGYHETMFDGSQLASGVYLYKLQTNSAGRQPFVEIKKMILVK